MQKAANRLFEIEESRGNAAEPASWKYAMIYEKLYHEDIGEYYTYGISVVSECVRTFHDISTIRERVEEIVRLFNRYQLSPTHFQEAIEDMLA